MKPIQSPSENLTREAIQSIPDTSNNRSMKSTSTNLAEPLASESDEEDSVLQNYTNPSLNTRDIAQEINSLSEKLINNSIRQIRPGDRVKTVNKKKSVDVDQQTISSKNDSQSYSRSVITSKNDPNKSNVVQLNSNVQSLQTKLDEQQRQLAVYKNKPCS